jgi:hypothetical protein
MAVYMQDEVTYEDLVKAFPEGGDYVITEKSTDSNQDLQDDIKEREEWDTLENS